MPTLSMFYGIIVRMFMEKGSKHNVPHIHAMYSGQNVVVSLDGKVIEGSLPTNKMIYCWHGWKFIQMNYRQIGNYS